MRAYTPTKLITDSPEIFDRWCREFPHLKTEAVALVCGTVMFVIHL